MNKKIKQRWDRTNSQPCNQVKCNQVITWLYAKHNQVSSVDLSWKIKEWKLLFISAVFCQKKTKFDFRTLWLGPNVQIDQTPPPHLSGVLKFPRELPNYSNFKFLHCISIIENNISTKFDDNLTNFGRFIIENFF